MKRATGAVLAALIAAAFVGTGTPRAGGAQTSPAAASRLGRLADLALGSQAGPPRLRTASASTEQGPGTTARVTPAALSGVADALKDGEPCCDDRDDITSFDFSVGSQFSASVSVVTGTDPTSAEWAGDTGAVWPIDVNLDGTTDFAVVFGQDDTGQVGGAVLDANGNQVCDANGSWNGANTYQATFDPACIGNPTRFAVASVFLFDTAPDDASNDPFQDHAPNVWQPWENLDAPQPTATLVGGPDIAGSGVGRLDEVAGASDSQLLWRRYNSGTWSGYTAVGGVLTSDPSVAADPGGSGHLDAFVRGSDNQLWHTSYNGTAWSSFDGLGGVLQSAPDAASWGPGRLDVFVEGTDHQLWHRWYDGTWHAWEPLGGVLTSSPAAVSWSLGRLDVFVRGTDNQLWHTWYEEGWHAYEPLGGVLSTSPDAASWGPGRIDVVVGGTDNQVWHTWYSGGWQGYEPLGNGLQGDPAIGTWGALRLDVLAIIGASTWHKAYS